jgi:predicted PolB exonuclease-like 3'-5' exonuclease
MNTLVFDIETVPDVAFGRRLYGLEGLSDAQIAKAMFALRRQTSGSEFLAHEQHRIVAISCVLRSREGLRVWSLGDERSPESELIERFFDGIERFTPCLVSWNGSGFDLPVLQYRGLLAGVQAARYWETGDEDTAFRYNNYLGRYHWRHIDLMDVLSGFQGRSRASLSNIACLLGLPGKMGFSGAQVWDAYRAGNLGGIRRYCETDVLNTYLIFLRFELMRGRLTRERHAEEVERVRALLRSGRDKEPHFGEFLDSWDMNAASAPAADAARPPEGAA